MADSIIRMPYPLTTKRPVVTRPADQEKYNTEPVNLITVKLKVKRMNNINTT